MFLNQTVKKYLLYPSVSEKSNLTLTFSFFIGFIIGYEIEVS